MKKGWRWVKRLSSPTVSPLEKDGVMIKDILVILSSTIRAMWLLTTPSHWPEHSTRIFSGTILPVTYSCRGLFLAKYRLNSPMRNTPEIPGGTKRGYQFRQFSTRCRVVRCIACAECQPR